MSNFQILRDDLINEQDKAHVEFSKTKSKRKIKELGMKIHNLGEQINTISHVKLELDKHGINNIIINKKGVCYYCGEIIDLETQRCVIYRSMRNQTISLFHEPHFYMMNRCGMVHPIATIGRRIDK